MSSVVYLVNVAYQVVDITARGRDPSEMLPIEKAKSEVSQSNEMNEAPENAL